MSDAKRQHWEDRSSTPLVVAAVLFLAAYAWPILQPDLPRWADRACRWSSVAIWIAFGLDLIYRLVLAEQRRRFLRENWLDLVTLLLPFLRPLRALRVVLALNMIGRRGGAFSRGRVVAAVAASEVVVGLVAALAVLDAERGRVGSNIETFGDALWWAVSTITTVGYGDRYPTTGQGRLIAFGLMASGIALLGVITAAMASWFVAKLSEVEASELETEHSVSDLAGEVRLLREELGAYVAAANGRTSPR